ncbi:S1C family serine protease [Erythrobacter donghaensis]|uniref:S1C family serine protease n=1 Tax=Erythrobacter donghaensis TaxID=267135 RepID=UPI00093FB540|nr:trypsin-like peptidase domain-containing protein [Erythrobacter donghaensis]
MPSSLFAAEFEWTDAVSNALRSLVRIEVSRSASGPSIAPHRHGSGFVISPDGLVVTNAHVVSGAQVIQLSFPDGQTFSARLIDAQPLVDLALLQIEGARSPLPALQLAEADYASPGRPVAALGSPMSYPFSVSSGIISGFDRHYSDQNAIFLLQHDAALNPGNSGGPLIGPNGKVIGVNTATPAETQYDIGIGLAVPSSVVAPYVERVLREGRYEYGALGLRVRKLGASAPNTESGRQTGGLTVEQVFGNSAAAEGRILAGDVILKVDGQPLTEPVQLARILWTKRPGEQLALTVQRTGDILTQNLALQSSVVLAAMQPELVQTIQKVRDDTPAAPDFGLTLIDVPVRETARVIAVAVVAENSPAQLAGLGRGDVVLQINGMPLRDAESAAAILAQAPERATLLVARRGSEQQYITLNRDPDASITDGSFGAVY